MVIISGVPIFRIFTVCQFQSSPQKSLGFHIELPCADGSKVFSNSPGHMTNMASVPVHGKNL